MNPSIFKAYDVRGIYPQDIDEAAAYAIGRAAVAELGAQKLAVGRDARDSGPALHAALIHGILDAGCAVVDLGMITTPMLYFASWHLEDVDGAIAVTASHNPPEYNGIKICRRNALPVGSITGLDNIRDRTIALLDDPTFTVPEDLTTLPANTALTTVDIRTPYQDYVASFAHFGTKKFHVVIDAANTMGVLDVPIYEKFADNIKITTLYCDLNHAYEAHEANPLKAETLDELREKVVEVGASLGIAYDGDADRIGFVDERGDIVPMDLITGLLARIILADHPGATILYDLRSSQAVKEVIEEAGGVAEECRVGGPFIRDHMRRTGALLAGEISGHYYFHTNRTGELPTYAAFLLLNLMATTGTNVSALVADLRRYHKIPETNSTVDNPDAVIAHLKEHYSDGALDERDGIKISYWDAPAGQRWWFSVRTSNTEPVMRLNLEADTEELMRAKRDEVLSIIRN